MRKRFKKKKRSCPLCKPHKTGIENRWSAKELLLLKEFEKKKHDNVASKDVVIPPLPERRWEP